MGYLLRALARSPFLDGVARSVDLLGAFNQPNRYHGRDPVRADDQATASDWAAVGQDLWSASLERHRQREAPAA